MRSARNEMGSNTNRLRMVSVAEESFDDLYVMSSPWMHLSIDEK